METLKQNSLPNQPQATQEGLLFAHQDVTESARKIARHLIGKIANSIGEEEVFYKLIQRSDRASLTLQRLCSIICHIIPIEQNLMGKQTELFPSRKENRLTTQDFEIILHAANQFGLLKEGAENMIHDIIADLYRKETGRSDISKDEA